MGRLVERHVGLDNTTQRLGGYAQYESRDGMRAYYGIGIQPSTVLS